MTLEEFTPTFVELAMQLRATDADELTLRTYFNALKDLDVEFVQMGAERLARQAEWFPKTSEWRQTALHIIVERQRDLQALLRHLPTPLCQWCADTGWCPVPDTNRVMRCDCAALRWLEVLGRRPWPGVAETTDAQELQTKR